jgi:hypothetical protein
MAQRNIDVLSAEKRWTDDLQTNGLDGLRALAGSQVERDRNDALVNTSTLAWMYTGDVGVKEKHKMGKIHFTL